MEIVHMPHLENKTIYTEKNTKQVFSDEISEQLLSEKKYYALNLDGLEKDKPNLCLFQKTSNSYPLWIDSGPI